MPLFILWGHHYSDVKSLKDIARKIHNYRIMNAEAKYIKTLMNISKNILKWQWNFTTVIHLGKHVWFNINKSAYIICHVNRLSIMNKCGKSLWQIQYWVLLSNFNKLIGEGNFFNFRKKIWVASTMMKEWGLL
jgi:hypothetical protein